MVFWLHRQVFKHERVCSNNLEGNVKHGGKKRYCLKKNLVLIMTIFVTLNPFNIDGLQYLC